MSHIPRIPFSRRALATATLSLTLLASVSAHAATTMRIAHLKRAEPAAAQHLLRHADHGIHRGPPFAPRGFDKIRSRSSGTLRHNGSCAKLARRLSH